MFSVLPRARLVAVALAVVCASCARAPVGGAAGLPSGALDAAIAGRVGDPTTCVMLAERASGRIVYRYGQLFNCVRGMPACDRPGSLTAQQALPLATTPGGRHASCPSSPDGTRSVGWAEGTVASASGRDLVYSAVMEGDRSLPGEEIAERLADAFRQAGL